MVRTLVDLGLVKAALALRHGRLDAAAAALDNATATISDLEDLPRELNIDICRSHLCRQGGELEPARELAAAAVERSRTGKYPIQQGFALLALAESQAAAGDVAAAVATVEQGDAVFTTIGHRRGVTLGAELRNRLQ
jgi:hypothetical protein